MDAEENVPDTLFFLKKKTLSFTQTSLIYLLISMFYTSYLYSRAFVHLTYVSYKYDMNILLFTISAGCGFVCLCAYVMSGQRGGRCID